MVLFDEETCLVDSLSPKVPLSFVVNTAIAIHVLSFEYTTPYHNHRPQISAELSGHSHVI